MHRTPYAQYRQTQAQTANRTQLVVMLYEGMIRFCTAAELAVHAHDIQGRHDNLVKAQAILVELLGSLNHAEGGDLAANLGRIYDYCHRRLVEANIKAEAAIIVEVRDLLSDLLPAWREIAVREQATAAPPTSVRLAV